MYICISGCGIRLDLPQDLQLRVELRGSRIMSDHRSGAPVPARDFSCGTAQGRVVWCCCCYHSVPWAVKRYEDKSGEITDQRAKHQTEVWCNSCILYIYIYTSLCIYIYIIHIYIYIYIIHYIYIFIYLFIYHRYNFESDFVHSKLDVLIKYEVPLTFK